MHRSEFPVSEVLFVVQAIMIKQNTVMPLFPTQAEVRRSDPKGSSSQVDLNFGSRNWGKQLECASFLVRNGMTTAEEVSMV